MATLTVHTVAVGVLVPGDTLISEEDRFDSESTAASRFAIMEEGIQRVARRIDGKLQAGDLVKAPYLSEEAAYDPDKLENGIVHVDILVTSHADQRTKLAAIEGAAEKLEIMWPR